MKRIFDLEVEEEESSINPKESTTTHIGDPGEKKGKKKKGKI